MELGDAEAVGIDDHHDARVRNVDADLDHRGGDQQLQPALLELVHHRANVVDGMELA